MTEVIYGKEKVIISCTGFYYSVFHDIYRMWKHCRHTTSDTQMGNTVGNTTDDVEKPDKITIMVDGTFNTKLADGQEEWINKWEEMTGIELEVIQPDHMLIMMCWDRHSPADRRTGLM